MSYASLEQAQQAAARLQRRHLQSSRKAQLDPVESRRNRRPGLHNSKVAGGLGAALLAVAASCWLAYGEPASAEVQGYRITHGDKVSVTVYGQTELSGDFVVDQNGSVRIPVIGDVAAEDQTASQLEKEIAAALSRDYVKSPVVSVRISEFSPVNVVGLVRNPGLFQYRQGMTVLSAIVQAGGLGLAGGARQDAVMGDILQSEERVRLLEISRVRLLAKRARLSAQLDDRGDIDFSELRTVAADPAAIAQILEGERRQFKMEAESLQQRMDVLQKQKERLQAEIASIDMQKDLISKQRKLNGELLGDYESLMKSGLVRKAPLIEAKREEARLDGQFARLESERLAAEMQVSDADFKLGDLRSEARRRSYAELQESEKALMDLSVTLPTARRTQAVRTQQGGVFSEDGQRPAILIIRQKRGRSEQQEADLDAALRPGDIVQIGALFGPATGPMVAAPPPTGPSGGTQAPARVTNPDRPTAPATPINIVTGR